MGRIWNVAKVYGHTFLPILIVMIVNSRRRIRAMESIEGSRTGHRGFLLHVGTLRPVGAFHGQCYWLDSLNVDC